jgi:DNA-binding CsgD family transcriptional regulator
MADVRLLMADGHAGVGDAVRLRGRASECAVLDAVIADLRRGESRVLVIRGEAGVGKTALVEYLIEAAAGLRVGRAVGAESEMELAFAGLHQLCAPLLDHSRGLPGPQREALETVFGVRAGPAPDRFLVGLAVLGLLSQVSDEQPLLCVVDDAQWLDQASARTLAFVARRLGAEPVGLVFVARGVGEELGGLPELEVGGLGDRDARALLGSVVRFFLDHRVRDRIVAETRGNPLALLELPHGLTAAQLAGGFGGLQAQALSQRIERSFSARLAELPDDARLLLLVAAAEPIGDPLLLWRAAERLGIGLGAADRAQAGGLLAIRQLVTFRHPLVRSAVYRSAPARQRRDVHLALAEVTDPQAEPDRRAWHLAAAAAGPDEEVAAELEQSAGRAQARGGPGAAAALLGRSVALTRDPARRVERTLAAAHANLQAGAFGAALDLLDAVETSALTEFQRARVDLLRGQIAFASGLGPDAAPLLLRGAERLVSLDLELARETYLSAWAAAAFAERTGAGHLPEVCRAVRALPAVTAPARPFDLLLDGLALLITDGRAAAAATLRHAAQVFASDEVPVAEGLRWGWLATAASFAMWDNDAARTICDRQIQRVRATGALEGLPLYLVALGVATAWSGEFAGAASLIREGDEVTAATGAQIPPFARLLLQSLRGNEADATALIDATLTRAAASGQGAAATEAQWAAAVLANGLGRYEQALTAAQQASSDPLDLYPSMWALPELVEAAARHGEAVIARAALKRLAATTQPSGTDFGLGIEARSRALVSEGEAAEQLYREAIERLGRTSLHPELARAHLVYGEWLRQAGRRADARVQLRAAHERCVSIGMMAFAERARRELVAIGEKVRPRTTDTPDDLTAQERQIARFASDGLSNPEIAARLFLSPRTIEYHLRKVFAKLEISSRRELADKLAAGVAPF